MKNVPIKNVVTTDDLSLSGLDGCEQLVLLLLNHEWREIIPLLMFIYGCSNCFSFQICLDCTNWAHIQATTYSRQQNTHYPLLNQQILPPLALFAVTFWRPAILPIPLYLKLTIRSNALFLARLHFQLSSIQWSAARQGVCVELVSPRWVPSDPNIELTNFAHSF